MAAKLGFVWSGAIRIVGAMNDAERLTLLEERYAHLQRHVVEQDKAVLKLGEELAKLRQEIALLRGRETGDSPTGGMSEERPPHY
jgi:uncharacterized coiled-coil protein SlyX